MLSSITPNMQEKIHSERAARLAKYQGQYPNATIGTLFLLDIARAEREEKPCAGCKGYPCGKTSAKGYQHFVTVENGGLNIRYKRCPYSAIAHNKSVAKIPAMYVGKTFADYKIDSGNQNAVKGAKTLCSLYIYGAPGTGKTFLAAVMAQELLKQGKSVIFTDTPSLLDEMKSTFDRESESTLESVMLKLSKVDVLVLDDLGTETPTEWAVERLYLIVNARYNAQKMLIVTSNYDLQQAAEKLNKPAKGEVGVTGSRIVSRIRGLCKVAQIRGADKRRC